MLKQAWLNRDPLPKGHTHRAYDKSLKTLSGNGYVGLWVIYSRKRQQKTPNNIQQIYTVFK